MLQDIGELVILFWKTLRALPLTWRHRSKVASQFFEIGNSSLLMACFLSIFIGGVLSLQSGPMLVERGLGSAVGGLVGITVCKELAPVMMAILIAGRVGSSMAAEIGSMRVYQEIDALRTMNINPTNYLVLPRMVAITLALPMLVVFSVLCGWGGGALVASSNAAVNISWEVYFNNLSSTVDIKDLFNGLSKSLIFAVMIGIVCCHRGLKTTGGPRGIGQSVTKAVVSSIALILVTDYFITRVLMFVF